MGTDGTFAYILFPLLDSLTGGPEIEPPGS